jgi:tRNA pseudouridine55 synthase
MEDLLLIDKPEGITSFDVIRILRRKLGVRKMGHAGTLDPVASGLILIGVGEGTKRLKDLIGLDKEYIAEIIIGVRTTTGDRDGTVIEMCDVENLDAELVQEALRGMSGTLRLPVSAYSAMKRGGVPFYKLARKAERHGEELTTVPMRDMEVRDAELLDLACGDKRCVAKIRFAVGSGTYIRSLGEELGRRLGYPASLKSLRRTKVGDFDIKDAATIENME